MTEAEACGVEAWLHPGASGERLSVLDAPSYLLLRLSNRLSRRFNGEYLAELGLSGPVVRVLVGIRLFSAASFRQVVDSTTMDKAQVSRVMAGMFKDGLVAFEGPAKNPTRMTARTRASLTPAGEALYQRARELAGGHQVQLLNLLSAEQKRALYVILHRLLDETQGWEGAEARDAD